MKRIPDISNRHACRHGITTITADYGTPKLFASEKRKPASFVNSRLPSAKKSCLKNRDLSEIFSWFEKFTLHNLSELSVFPKKLLTGRYVPRHDFC